MSLAQRTAKNKKLREEKLLMARKRPKVKVKPRAFVSIDSASCSSDLDSDVVAQLLADIPLTKDEERFVAVVSGMRFVEDPLEEMDAPKMVPVAPETSHSEIASEVKTFTELPFLVTEKG